jgi:hypothetical protein
LHSRCTQVEVERLMVQLVRSDAVHKQALAAKDAQVASLGEHVWG